jgi:hypothetical protein
MKLQRRTTGLRILITGGRDFCNTALIYDILDKLHAEVRVEVLIHGACPTGADSIAKAWAKARSVTDKPYPAPWNQYGPAAGPMRNTFMVTDSKPDLAVVFPGGNGTLDCARKIAARKIGFLKVAPDGRVTLVGDACKLASVFLSK